MVCFNGELSASDARLDRAYHRALSMLPSASQRLLKQSEHGWLAYLDVACQLDLPVSRQGQEICLFREYRERTQALQQAAVRRGRYLFTRVDIYRASRGSGEKGSLGDPLRPSLLHVAYPRIDKPAGALAVKWNSLMVRGDPGTDCGSDGADITLDYKLGLATGRLISVRWDHGEYCHGTPHGHWDVTAQTLLMSQDLRVLRASDLFGQDGVWREKLTEVAVGQAREAARSTGDERMADDATGAICDAVTSPDRWFLTREGINVAFNSYELGFYVFNFPVEIAWSKLADMLTPASNRLLH